MSRPYKIPKNLCQLCYEVNARFIMDCYCILCEQCYQLKPPKGNQCQLCRKVTKGHKIDARQESSIRKVAYMFDNLDTELSKFLEVYKFQNEVANRYCLHLEQQLLKHKKAIAELVAINPSLQSFFGPRLRVKTQMTFGEHPQERATSVSSRYHQPTVKPKKEYTSEVYESKRSTITHNHQDHRQEMQGIRQIGRADKTHSGNVVYKVPNINYSTAVRSSKRANHEYIYGEHPDSYTYHRR